MKNATSHRRVAQQGCETTSSHLSQQDEKQPADQLIDEYVMARIDYRVWRLADDFDLSQDDQESCRHDMILELLGAFDRFDPGKAKRETFVNRVLDKFVKYTVRIWCTQRRRACDSPIGFDDVGPGYEPVVNDTRAGQINEQGHRELRLDMDAAITRMPQRLQRACRLLMKFTPAETAAQLGVCRQSVSRIMAEIRPHLSRFGLGD